jgi:hypothetical protein
MRIRDENGKVHFRFFLWPSIIISLFLTVLLNLVLYIASR